MNRLYLGKIRKAYTYSSIADRKVHMCSYIAGKKVYLDKHSFECKWYWSFGHISGKGIRTHFDSVFLTPITDIDEIFEETKISQNAWWIIRDLFIQAYALKKCARIYKYGGHQTTKKDITDIIKSQEMADKINQDLERILDKIWDVITAEVNKPKLSKKEVLDKFNTEIKPKIKDKMSYDLEWMLYVKNLHEDKKITTHQFETWVNPF